MSDARAWNDEDYQEPRHPVEEVIEAIEDLADHGQKWYCRIFPGLWGKTVIDHSALLQLIRELRERLPHEMSEAISIATRREEIIREAQQQRDRIIQAAREQAQIIVSNDELVRQAQERADQVLRAARTEAEAIRVEAESWARGVVERLEGHLRRVLSTLERAKRSLGAPGLESSIETPPEQDTTRNR
ncbi:MAG: hypothetical protein H5T86_11735 [Armatimonadetes bacterium]|nr:hypothetical protein [Armatimonadota bacterium]